MQLRDYQMAAEAAVYQAWQTARNVLVVLATGSGKTVLFAKIISDHVGASCAIAHRQELVGQISLALARYGVKHRIIGPNKVIRWIIQALHILETGHSFYDPNAPCAVAGVDTLIRRGDDLKHWTTQVTLCVQDEAHHVLKDNKWGKAFKLFPNAKALGVTANTERADGKGLGKHADGIMEVMVEGPTMRELIDQGYLTDYRIFAPPSDLDLNGVTIGSAGDYSPKQLKQRVQKSHIMGDVVSHYLKLAPGKLGITFATDVETATDISAKFNAAGVPAEVVSAKTPDQTRTEILRRFKLGQIKQLVNVDLFGEGFDLPAIEVVSMARPTESFNLYCLDPETEILTPEGWKGSECVLDVGKVIAFDLDFNEVRPVKVLSTIKRKLYDHETIYGISSPHLDIAVSDKHRIILKSTGATCKNWQGQIAEKVAKRKSMFRVPVAGDGNYKGAGLSESELHLLGWYLSDGNIGRLNNALYIGQAVNKVKHTSHIRKTLQGCGLKFGELVRKRKNVPATHHDTLVFSVSKGKPRGTGKHLRGWAYLEKWLDKSVPECYDSLTRDELLILLYSLNLGDGVNNHSSLDYVKKTLTITCGVNKHMADRLQALCVTRGLRCNMATPHYEGRSKWYVLHIRDAQTATIAGVGVKDGTISGKKSYKRSRFKALPDNRPSFVWCVENELGTLITRRNGKVAIVGNCQQFGRALRLLEGKEWAIIIDHVGNVQRHGLPDAYREWTLDRRERRSRSKVQEGMIPVKTCPQCTGVYEAIYKECSFCGFVPIPTQRSSPEFVDGDLHELDPATLVAMRGEIDKIDLPADVIKRKMEHAGAPGIAAGGAAKQHRLRQEAQIELRDAIAWWAGYERAKGRHDSESYRRFYHTFKVDVMTAQTLGRPEAELLASKINSNIGRATT